MSFRVQRQVHVRATPAELWPIVSDTDRTNRLLGQSEVTYTPTGDDSLERFEAQTSIAGYRLRYRETPFEWRAPQRLRVRRVMIGSPFVSYTFGVRLEEVEGGTLVQVDLEIELRHTWGLPLAWLVGQGFVAQYQRLLAKAERALRANPALLTTPLATTAPAHPFVDPRSPTDQDELARRARALRRLRGDAPGPSVEQLLGFLQQAPDVDIAKIRPFELAEAWSQPRGEVLALCLQAVQTGLCELRFAVVCPSCLVPSDTVAQLAELNERGHCDQCDLTFDLDLDRAVEVIFRAHPAVRSLQERVFCLGSPARSPHVLEQRHFAPGEQAELGAPGEAGRYRLFLRGGASCALEIGADGAAEAEVEFDGERVTPTALLLAPGARLRVHNRGADARHGKIERLAYASYAATVHEVSVIPEFRRFCSKDLLKAGTPLRVANVALLFTDLTGSTQMYSEIGDAAAFRVVDDHFDVLKAAVVRHGGTLIKTMGDAVMASFLDTSSATVAAADALDEFEAWRQGIDAGKHIGLKLGVHAGPCYVITANDALDYFGQTVNVAARLQGLAGSAEITMLSEAFAALPEAVRQRLHVRSQQSAQLKGVTGAVDVVHLTRPKVGS